MWLDDIWPSMPQTGELKLDHIKYQTLIGGVSSKVIHSFLFISKLTVIAD